MRLLIVDNAPTRAGIRMALGDDVTVCAEETELEQAIRAAKREQPDIAFIGREIAGDWRALVRGVCRAAPLCAVVVLAQTSDADDMLESVRAGAVGYVPGALDADRLRRVFARAAAEARRSCRASMVNELLSELRGTHNAENGLTGREAQVLGMLRRGHSTAWIAERLADRAGHRAPPHLRARSQARRREPLGPRRARRRSSAGRRSAQLTPWRTA